MGLPFLFPDASDLAGKINCNLKSARFYHKTFTDFTSGGKEQVQRESKRLKIQLNPLRLSESILCDLCGFHFLGIKKK